MKICLASGNVGKIKEFNDMATNLAITFIPQSDFNAPEAVEDAPTFIENALIKARHGATVSGLPALADDSGLVVDALKGAPGIYSARYAGSPSDARKNIQKLLEALSDVPDGKRTARFYSLIAFVKDPADPTPIVCQGVWEGEITRSPMGTGGFGYDPVFFIPSLNCTAAELNPTTKHNMSHRGKSLKSFFEVFESFYHQLRI